MLITICPDPECIELIRSENESKIINFLENLGLNEEDSKKWESTHTLEINENDPPTFKFYPMYRCYLPKELFNTSQWVFKYTKKEFFESLEISGYMVFGCLFHSFGLEQLPRNILNLYCGTFVEIKNLFFLKKLKYFNYLKSLSLSDCKSLKDIKLIKNLINLQSLDLSYCESLTDISVLSNLVNLKHLDLSNCESLKNIDCSPNQGWKWWQWISNKSINSKGGLSNLVNLNSLNLNYCKSITDISCLSGLMNLESLDLGRCKSIKDINSLSGLINLQSLNIESCESLTDISVLSKLLNLKSLKLYDFTNLSDINFLSRLVNLQSLDLSLCRSLKNISVLSNFIHLENLDLSYCTSIDDLSSLSNLVKLKKLNLSKCFSVSDVSSLSGLVNLEHLELRDCGRITNINFLSNLINLKYLDLRYLSRVRDFSALRNCTAITNFFETNLHPVEYSELLIYLAVKRKDTTYIAKYWKESWIIQLKLGLNEQHPIINDLACSLAKGVIIADLESDGLSFHQTLLDHNNVTIPPWKIWLFENLSKYGWDKFQKLSEIKPFSDLTYGAIGGISSCLPTLDAEESQITWSKKWISEIHSLHKNNPAFLRPAAAEWCLALKRLGEDQLLKEWIGKFTDPSDPSALDPINQVFSDYTLKLNDRESALEYALKIYDPKLRDESILNLANQFLMEKEITKAGDFLFLLTEIEYRTKLAISLADDAAYLKNDENAHRLIAACGDDPISLAKILNKIQQVNPSSEILKIMHEKLRDNDNSYSIASIFIKDAIKNTIKLFEIKDSTKLTKIQQAIESIVNSN